MPTTRARYLPAWLGLVAILLHLRSVGFDFVFDDQYLVVRNSFLREPLSLFAAFAHHFWYGTPFAAGYYRPIVVSSFALNGALTGWGPAGFHFFNLALHAANVVLLFFLARRLGVPERGAFLATLLFAVHPVASWPVASVVARVDLLPAFFVLLAWNSLMSPRSGHGPSLLAGLFFLAALLCKESAVAFLAVLLLSRRPGAPEAAADRRDRTLTSLTACMAALGVYVTLRIAAKVPLLVGAILVDPLINPLAHLPFPARLFAALRLSGRYLFYLVVPARFGDAADYNPGARPPASLPLEAFCGLLFILGVAILVLGLWRRRRPETAPVAFALLSFLPASNLLAPIGSLYAQNFLYLPLIGMSLAIGLAFGASFDRACEGPLNRGRLASATVIVIAMLLAWASFREAAIWRDGLSLFTAWTERFPRYSLAQSGLGVAHLDRNEPQAALGPLRRALELNHDNAEAHYNLGVALIQTGKEKATLEEALSHTRAAVALDPTLVQGRVNASKILLLLDRPAEAETEAREALRLAPGFVPARLNLAESLYRQKRYKDAAALFKELAVSFPDDPNVLSPLVVSLIHAGELAEARRQAEAARQILPDLAWFDFCLARIEARENHRAAARALLQTALAKDPAVRQWMAKVEEFTGWRL